MGLWERFLTFFGKLKYFWRPPVIVYDPRGYQVKGRDVRRLIDEVQPGDVLVRRFHNYVDGLFIPGYFSHVGLYLGEVTDQNRTSASNGASVETGRQMVIHAVAEGVQMEDLLDFSRTDELVIMRFPASVGRSDAGWREPVKGMKLEPDEQKIFDALVSGSTVPFATHEFPVIKRAALSKLGSRYDFGFNFASFTTLSCTELVYFATKCLGPFHGIAPRRKRVLWRANGRDRAVGFRPPAAPAGVEQPLDQPREGGGALEPGRGAVGHAGIADATVGIGVDTRPDDLARMRERMRASKDVKLARAPTHASRFGRGRHRRPAWPPPIDCGLLDRCSGSDLVYSRFAVAGSCGGAGIS